MCIRDRFNIYVDPEAARIVFQSGIPITMVGLDVTRKTTLTDEHLRRLEAGQNPASQAAAKIARNAIDHNREQGFLVGPNMHDSLAVASFIDPTLLKWKEYYVDVETTGELTAGETLGYSPTSGDLKRRPDMEKQAAEHMAIRPISISKNRAESTSTPTLVFGTNFSRTTGDVRMVANVGAEPRIAMCSAACFSMSGRRFRSPDVGL